MLRLFYFLFLISFSTTAQINFTDEAINLGLNVNTGITYLGNGVSFCDYNQDGWDDITLTTGVGQSLRFFKNINGVFLEETFDLISTEYQTKQVNWVDFDNDGDKDIFLTSDVNGLRLIENTGNLVFQDITANSGIPIENFYTYGASWGDYNNDGYLDVFISNRDSNFIIPNYLYKNNGDGTFTNVSTQAGILNTSELSFCSAFFDFNNDGWQDIYVSNDKVINQNRLYKNNGDNTFSEISESSGTDISIDAMTTTIGDYNNDGWQDIYITNGPAGNVLFKNNGDETFTDIALQTGTIFNSIGWGAVFLDAENDMDLDLYVSGSLDGSYPNYLSSAFYINNADETYALSSNSGFLYDNGASYSNAIGDIDNDGFPEILVSNNDNENVFLWKNNTVSNNNWLKIKTVGVLSNKDGIGTKIEISVNGEKQYRYVHCGEGYLSQNSSTEIVGLGTNTIVDYIKFNWLSGTEDIFYNVASNQTLSVVEGSSSSLSVNDSAMHNYNIWPNPVKNKLTLEAKELINFYEVYTILGVKIITSDVKDFSFKINTSQLNSGSYFLKFFTNKNNYTIKFIKL
ncbi:FG-GAP-like repeat-containing protein [uncultured Lacinutrix sp.]|uniref:FG-GAP-like repeat-containing protein n=1 Tax=uncultured Lacinutrix sp. TaxID=574032 RepID=UPI00261426A5|nr:FG-GAP-like repeat-containing protein [uncultured Lacinutrix sp.]